MEPAQAGLEIREFVGPCRTGGEDKQEEKVTNHGCALAGGKVIADKPKA
jgi:hypothetical protein